MNDEKVYRDMVLLILTDHDRKYVDSLFGSMYPNIDALDEELSSHGVPYDDWRTFTLEEFIDRLNDDIYPTTEWVTHVLIGINEAA